MYSNLFDINDYINAEDAEFLGTFILIFLVIFFIALLIGVFKIICRWIIFKKAGKEGWEAIVPYYNNWTFYEISGYPGWFALIALASFIPYVGALSSIAIIVFDIMASISLAKKFNKSVGFGVLLGLLPIIGLPILAFGKDEYDDSLGEHYNIQK